MKWQTKEMDTYLQAKEYVDTALIPLVPISWKDDVKSTVAMGEFISMITHEVERQFHGRVVHFPSFTYLKAEEMTARLERLESWITELKAGGVTHFIFLTSDGEWKTSESEIEGLLTWLPTIPLEHLEESYKREIIADQLKQLIPILTKKWQES
ncbi:YpiF family protein [Halalkalibacter oceani]|uniref:YpiF family protein n=1 Tax=Halalkalibacter oceani TaxID=1653776 RepID=A0A9X2DMW5_9BACI|nr:YpiF family protein [Halalkalibacter oceani]MCM3713579.1 YpiF family protein [Halalkalibacter oceani]